MNAAQVIRNRSQSNNVNKQAVQPGGSHANMNLSKQMLLVKQKMPSVKSGTHSLSQQVLDNSQAIQHKISMYTNQVSQKQLQGHSQVMAINQ